MTNYERIKNMSVEEMTVFLDDMGGNCMDCASKGYNNRCPIYKEGYCCRPNDMKQWLESEVSDNG